MDDHDERKKEPRTRAHLQHDRQKVNTLGKCISANPGKKSIKAAQFRSLSRSAESVHNCTARKYKESARAGKHKELPQKGKDKELARKGKDKELAREGEHKELARRVSYIQPAKVQRSEYFMAGRQSDQDALSDKGC